MSRRDYSCNTSFLDLLFNMLLAFTAMFVLALALASVKQKESEAAKPRAEFLVTLTWPDEADDDLDLWVEDPHGRVVFFQRREDGLMHLDRDDLGVRNDVVQTEEGPINFPGNQEVITIRGIVPGEYVVNVHAYLMHSSAPVKAVARIDRLGSGTVTIKDVVLAKSGDEVTVIRFTVGSDGKITSTSTLQKSLLGARNIP